MQRVFLLMVALEILLSGSALWAGQPVAWTTLFDQANHMYAEHRYAEAEGLYRAALAGARTAHSDDPQVAQLLNNIGAQNHMMGRYKEAEEWYRLALTEWRKHPEMSDGLRRTRQNLAGICRSLGRFTDSEALYLENLSELEKSAGAESAEYAGTLNELALLCLSMGRNAEAQAFAERSVAIAERLGPRDGLYPIKLHTLAAAYGTQGDSKRAEVLLRKVMGLLNETDASNDFLRAAVLNSMCELACSRADFAKAESLAREAVALWEHSLGTNHSKVGIGLNNLAQSIRLQGRFAEAEPLYFRALSILGSNPDSVVALAKCQGNLADSYHAQGKEPRAVEHYDIALSLMTEALGKSHPEVAILKSRLAEVRRAQLHFQESIELYRSSIPILEASYGGNDPRVRKSVASYRQAQQEAGHYLLPVKQ